MQIVLIRCSKENVPRIQTRTVLQHLQKNENSYFLRTKNDLLMLCYTCVAWRGVDPPQYHSNCSNMGILVAQVVPFIKGQQHKLKALMP